ncbi:MAG: hypothetical protein IPJ06_07755 [Saprospiraceae bacterium]|nr:hypothetical protein [Saprospiraceae bacterium]
MTVSFNPTVISFDQIKQRIADVGYDSDSHRATDEVYNNLPGVVNMIDLSGKHNIMFLQ